jgi:hypothetical protein
VPYTLWSSVAISATPMFLRVKWRITGRCSSLDLWFVHVHKTLNGRYSLLEHRLTPEFGWHYVGDGGVLSHVIWRVAFHELAVLEAILRTFWPRYTICPASQQLLFHWPPIMAVAIVLKARCAMRDSWLYSAIRLYTKHTFLLRW